MCTDDETTPIGAGGVFEADLQPVAGRRWRIVVRGELDVQSAPVLEGVLDEALAADPDRIVIDLRDLAFCDGAGLGCLIGCRDRAAERGCALRLERPSRRTARLFELAGVAELLA